MLEHHTQQFDLFDSVEVIYANVCFFSLSSHRLMPDPNDKHSKRVIVIKCILFAVPSELIDLRNWLEVERSETGDEWREKKIGTYTIRRAHTQHHHQQREQQASNMGNVKGFRLLPNYYYWPLSWIIFMVSMSPVIPEMIYRVDPLGKYFLCPFLLDIDIHTRYRHPASHAIHNACDYSL